MSKVIYCLFALALLLAPACAFAESSLSDAIINDESLNTDDSEVSLDSAADTAVAHPPRGGRPGPRPGHGGRPAPPPPRPAIVHVHRPAPVVVYHPRPVRPVVVVEQPATTVVVDNSESYDDSDHAYKLGFGIRGVGAVNSNIFLKADSEFRSSQLHNKFNGGFGFYIKIRPIRWISVELINDYMFGTFDNIQLKEFFKVPLVVGLRGHVFDYGGLDLYGVAAASVTFVSYDTGDAIHCNSDVFAQFGAQFGGGISFIASGFEIGLDMRYTIEEAPDQAPYTYDANGYREMGTVDSSKPIHGFLFSVNVGFAL